MRAALGLTDVLAEEDRAYAEGIGIMMRDGNEKDLNAVPEHDKPRGLLRFVVDGERLTLESYVYVNGKRRSFDVKYVDLHVPLNSWRHGARKRSVHRAIEKLKREVSR